MPPSSTTSKPFTKSTAFLGITIDGHIARTDGSIDYLPPAPTSDATSTNPSAQNNVDVQFVPTITTMLQSSSVLVLGRHTYNTALSLPTWPYGRVPLVVLSTATPSAIPLPAYPDVPKPTVISSLSAFLEHCTKQNPAYERVWVDGGATVRSFLEAGLLDEMVLTTVPVVLGQGISLFGGLRREIRCKVVGSEIVEGLVATWWRVVYGDVDDRGRLLESEQKDGESSDIGSVVRSAG